MEQTAFHRHLLAEMELVRQKALSLAGNVNEADELAQQTFLKALGAASRFELREHGMRPWLLRILKNCFYTKRTREGRGPRQVADLEWAAGSAGPPSDASPIWNRHDFNWDAIDERLKWALDSLDERYRSVLLLWALEGLKYREIAQRLQLPIGTVMSRLYRARSILTRETEELAREYGFDGSAAARGGPTAAVA
jgi:RNA polymerase sigma-70 factor (ECF subfamily)